MQIVKSELRQVKLRDIVVTERFRKDYGDLEELANNIKEHGVLQPVSLNKNMELAAGGRRYAAAVMAGLDEIPALIRDTEEHLDKLEVELFENIYRKDMEWAEEVKLKKAINDLYTSKYGDEWSGRKTAELLNTSIGGVSQDMKLARAIEEVPELAKIKTKKDALKFLNKVADNERIQAASVEYKKKMEEDPDYDWMARADKNYRVGDCFEGMAEAISTYREWKTSSQVKLIECDPPYAIDLMDLKRKGGIPDEHLEKYKEIDKEKYPGFLKRLTQNLYECAAPNAWCIFWFGPTWFTETKAALLDAGFKVDDIPGIWVKGSEDSEGTGQTNSPDIYLARCYEPFFIARKGNPILRQKGRSNVFSYKPVPASKKYHPTQRPIALIEELLRTFAYPGDIVMVPFLGSGTTLLAAYRQEMMAYGWELNNHNKAHFLKALEADRKLIKEDKDSTRLVDIDDDTDLDEQGDIT